MKLKVSEIVALAVAALLVISVFLPGIVLKSNELASLSFKVSVFSASTFAGILALLSACVLVATVFVKPTQVPFMADPKAKLYGYAAGAGLALLAFILVFSVSSVEISFMGFTGEAKKSDAADGEWNHGFGCWLELLCALGAGAAAYLQTQKK